MVANFNPYAPNPLHVTNGGIYEPLFFYNRAEAGDPTPRLGESYEWSEDGTELTVKIREGVKWSDGEDFTVEDVIFSYTNDAAKRDYLNTIDKVDESTVKFTFNGAQFTSAVQILGTTLMVPEHLFKEVPDLITYTNEEPVGTGPFTLDTITNATYTVVPNEDYWGGEPKLEKVRFLALDKNQSAQDLLATGKIDWTTMFIADPETVTGAGQVSLLNTPQDPTTIMSCSNAALGCAGPQTDLAVRQAVNLLVDRGEINEKAFSGHAAVASPSLALVGRDDRWISSEIEKESPQEGDPAEAAKVLEAAGYTKGADGIFEKDGQKLSVDLISVDGWSDHNAAGDLIAQQALRGGRGDQPREDHAAGDVRRPDERQLPDDDQRHHGHLARRPVRHLPPVAHDRVHDAGGRDDRGRPLQLPALLEPARRRGRGHRRRHQRRGREEGRVRHGAEGDRPRPPYIALVVNPTMSFVNTKNYTGWPSEDDMYAFPPSWATISNGVILSQLEPAS